MLFILRSERSAMILSCIGHNSQYFRMCVVLLFVYVCIHYTYIIYVICERVCFTSRTTKHKQCAPVALLLLPLSLMSASRECNIYRYKVEQVCVPFGALVFTVCPECRAQIAHMHTLHMQAYARSACYTYTQYSVPCVLIFAVCLWGSLQFAVYSLHARRTHAFARLQ